MARKYVYYGKRGVTIGNVTDAMAYKSNGRSYNSNAYGSVIRKLGTNRMRSSRLPRGQKGLATLRQRARGARGHSFYAFTKRVDHMTERGEDYGHRTILVRDPIRKRASTGHSGG